MKEEKNEEPTDSTTEESLAEETTEDSQLNPNHRTVAISSLIAGYVLAVGFAILLLTGSDTEEVVSDSSNIEEGEIVSAADVAVAENSVITLTGGGSIPWPAGKLWVDPGYTAIVGDEDLTAFVQTASFVDVNTPGLYKVIYTIMDPKTGKVMDSVERFVTVNQGGIISGGNIAYNDRLEGVVLGDEKITAVIGDDDDIVYVDNDDRHLRLHGDTRGGAFGGNGGNGRIRGSRTRVVEDDVDVGLLDRRLAVLDDEDLLIIEDDDPVARLDRKDIGLDRGGNDRVNVGNFVPDARRGDFDDEELGAVGNFDKNGAGFGKGTMPGVGQGSEVYAYNFPSQGVGAGIGSPAVGAAAGFAGLGAGIGQAVMDGQAVPALGGIGTYVPPAPTQPEGPDSDQDGISDAMEASFRTNPQSSDTDKDGVSDADEVKGMSNPRDPRSKPGTPAPGPDNDQDGVPASLESLYGLNPSNSDTDGDGFSDGEEIAAMTSPTNPASNPGEMGGPALAVAPGVAGGVAGLVGGAGAGAAAGLVSGRVSHPLGLGVAEPGPGYGRGGDGHGHDEWDYDHLPKDGNLFIMMHVDGSGSILSTRKALEEMKETLLKNALLPYYKNDEDLYNRRVLVVDGEGERTLKFFTDAAKKENVLALVFQDEAQPAYHLPNFNRKPEDHYIDDLEELLEGLNGYGGLYRGIMFQVDRGKTFAKSFKEFVKNAWNGDGYLSGEGNNLKPYHWQENSDNIRNRDGIVFSDEYHVNSEGDPAYYMNLIMEASRKIGLDLGKYGGGQEDGRYNAKVSNVSQSSSSLNSMCPVKPDRKANPSITAKNSRGETVAFCCNGCKNKFASAD
ncbi:DUF5011 domain-containing protein [Opitutales bacterium]|nr:DUF5011 domain-containing protein [Opitutales bacterium]